MSALGRVVRAGVGRRRVQTLVTVVTTLISVTAAILAAGLLVASSSPFDSAFARRHGAHLAAQFDATAVSAEQLRATDQVAGVTAVAGPFPTATVDARAGEGSAHVPAGLDLGPMTLVGRADPDGAVDELTLVAGAWPTEAGQVVISAEAPFPADVGDTVVLPDLPGSPTLEVVGVARSVTGTADAWATPEQVAALSGARSGYQVLYRFARAATAAQLDADRSRIAAAVPTGALTGSRSYLAVRQLAVANTAAFVPFLVAFGILGLLLSVLIVGVVVGGSVGAATRRIGVLKSLGFTPAQVARAYTAQALVPAAVGIVLGVVLGNLLAVPVLHGADTIAGAPVVAIPAWIDVAVAAGALVAVAGVALVPALRAGRLRTVEAIAAGRTTGGGHVRGGFTARWPLPRMITLGLAVPIARPGRAVATALAVVLGAAAVTFAVGLTRSLDAVQAGRDPDSSGAVVVTGAGGPAGSIAVPAPGQGTPVAFDAAAVEKAIAAHPGTRRSYGTAEQRLQVSGIAGTTTVLAYSGDSSWATHQMIAGRWLDGPGEAVVPTRLLTAAGADVGDTLTLTDEQGRSTTVRIVGEVFELSHDGMDLFTEASTFTALGLDGSPGRFTVDLDPGTDVETYVNSLQDVVDPLGAGAMSNPAGGSDVLAAMTTLVATFTVLLVVVAALGVFNVVLLDTRERAHDLGVLKALGMTPRQTVGMVLTTVTAIGLLAGVVGVPAGLALHHWVVPRMGAVADTSLPTEDIAVYTAPLLALLVLGGLVLAVAGALAPASWAAGNRAQVALRTE
ncbi:ABC transporter permease [Petropleomorpha daqingensis]|uniref:Putative ABC transport system permease protein n=1 Tax=Petropleomorpha daqingensis TaxID=2026353 RepID=A0A853CCJ6_9ACTN|nr:FtsX-like permease family protein [Petropleomorpha daqingensis]NYJ04756.1 putative ABC transport system permease protein [Petropleomorpha daqingensis]